MDEFGTPCSLSSYNQSVFRPFASLLASIVLLAACEKSIRSKEKVQEAILDRLQSRSGLDMKSLDVTTTAVSFDHNTAYATVAFHTKGDPSVKSMMMKYRLEARNGKWVVVNVADSEGHGMAGHAASEGTSLPPGHPPIGGADPGDPGTPPADAHGRVQ